MSVLGLPWLQLFPVLNLKPTDCCWDCNVSREFPWVSVCFVTLESLPPMTDEAQS